MICHFVRQVLEVEAAPRVHDVVDDAMSQRVVVEVETFGFLLLARCRRCILKRLHPWRVMDTIQVDGERCSGHAEL